MAWAILILGGLFEVGFTTCLRYVDGFRNVPWTLAFRVSVTISMGLLELAARYYEGPAAQALPPHALQQVRAFSQLLEAHFRTEKTVRYYAGRLALTANHLNAICRRVLNKTASDLIHERVVVEAQRGLAHSAQSVGQLADQLGFEDASYFARYFKKYVGQTPELFRQQLPINR